MNSSGYRTHPDEQGRERSNPPCVRGEKKIVLMNLPGNGTRLNEQEGREIALMNEGGEREIELSLIEVHSFGSKNEGRKR